MESPVSFRNPSKYVFRQVPIRASYFWTVYLCGSYTRDCCPEYPKTKNFERLKQGLAQCITPHTTTVTDFLQRGHHPISRFVLLDHMDWMSSYCPQELAKEWRAIAECASTQARILFRRMPTPSQAIN